jgi:hypothetical protein
MELVAADSQLSEAVLRALYQEFREGIQELAAGMEAPAHRVTDVARLAMARSFGTNLVALLEAPAALTDRETLRRRVNLAYEGMLILIDYGKWATDAPKVPRGRTTAA